MKKFTIEVPAEVRTSTRVEVLENAEIKREKVVEFKNGSRTTIPINPDGSVKWFDDSKLIRK